MKILLLSYYFPPLNSIASRRAESFAEHLVGLGHIVTVVTGKKPKNPRTDDPSFTPTYEVVEIESSILNWIYRNLGINKSTDESSLHNPRFSRLKKLRIRLGILTLGRLPDIFDSLVKPTKSYLGEKQYDLVISTFAPRYCHEVASALKENGQCKVWVADYRDLWTQHHQFSGVFPLTLFEKYKERRYMENADLVTTVSNSLAETLRDTYPNNAISVVPNGYQANDLHFEEQGPVNSKLINLVYTGTIYPDWNSVVMFLQALSMWKEKGGPAQSRKLRVSFIGRDLAGVASKIVELDLVDVVYMIGPVSRREALDAQRASDGQLFFESNSGAGIVSGKLFEYLSSGSEIWYLGSRANTEAWDIINATHHEPRLGTSVEAIVELLNQVSTSGRRRTVQRDLDEIAKYSRANIVNEFLQNLIIQHPELVHSTPDPAE